MASVSEECFDINRLSHRLGGLVLKREQEEAWQYPVFIGQRYLDTLCFQLGLERVYFTRALF